MSYSRDTHLVDALWSAEFNYPLKPKSSKSSPQLSILSTRPDEGYSPIPITQAVVLDPWLEPLSSPGPAPIDLSYLTAVPAKSKTIESTNNSSDSEITTVSNPDANNNSTAQIISPCPRLLVINSETFTIWKDHFARLQEVVKGWEGSILTVGE